MLGHRGQGHLHPRLPGASEDAAIFLHQRFCAIQAGRGVEHGAHRAVFQEEDSRATAQPAAVLSPVPARQGRAPVGRADGQIQGGLLVHAGAAGVLRHLCRGAVCRAAMVVEHRACRHRGGFILALLAVDDHGQPHHRQRTDAVERSPVAVLHLHGAGHAGARAL